MNKTFTVLLFLFVLPFSLLATTKDDDALAIYQALFEGRTRAVLPIPKKPDASTLIPDPEYKSTLKKEFPGIQDETIGNYTQAIIEPAPLTAASKLGLELIFVDDQTLNEIFSSKLPDAGWERFRKQFSCDRLSSVSQIAFNSARDQALVFRYESYGSLGAEGVTYFLIKKDGKWSIQGVFIESES